MATSLRLVLFVEFQQIIDIVFAAQEYGASFVNVCGYNIQDSPSSSRRNSSGLLSKECHGERLIQESQLSLLALLVIWVPEDATVQECSMDVRNHRPDVSSTVWRFSVRRIFDGVEVIDDWWVEVHRVALVERVDFASCGYLDIRMREDELSESAIKCVPVHTVPSGEN